MVAEARSILESIYIAPPAIAAQEIQDETARLLETIRQQPLPVPRPKYPG